MANNNLPTAANNALALSTQYPAKDFNVLVPIQTVAEIAEIQSPVMNVVYISTTISDGEIYEQQLGKYALTRKALLKLKPHGETLFALKGEFARGAGGGMQNSLYVRMKEILGIAK